MPQETITAENMDIYLAAPRGFCGGVCRAVGIVELGLEKYGVPLYVRHEIVHNKHVVEKLRSQGVVFIESFSEITDKNRPVIISAHGAPKKVYREAEKLGLKIIDATCPLVKKVHKKIVRLASEGKNIAIIGKAAHPEIAGTAGQLENYDKYRIISSPQEAETVRFDDEAPLGIVTQTTLSTTEVAEISAILQRRFGAPEILSQNDTCYATTHRQNAVRELTKHAEAIVVVGSKNSSNSRQLQKIAAGCGISKAFLIDDVSEMPWPELRNVRRLGISAGASAPEELVRQIIGEMKKRYKNLKIHDIIVARENVRFNLPAE